MGRPRALLVHTLAAGDLPALSNSLMRRGYDIAVTTTFQGAQEQLAAGLPDLLVTDLRLHEFNGLHLVLRAQSDGKRVAAVVLADSDDAPLRRQAEALGAVFVIRPASSDGIDQLIGDAISKLEVRSEK